MIKITFPQVVNILSKKATVKSMRVKKNIKSKIVSKYLNLRLNFRNLERFFSHYFKFA